MSVLAVPLRNSLERKVIEAREIAEKAATNALLRLGVEQKDVFKTHTEEEKKLRNTLRAQMRQIGGFEVLVEECAYEQWHQLLFARFLAENYLLMHPDGIAVSLEECQELAPMEGASDGWQLAIRYAARMLPSIFRPDDPLLEVVLAPESRQALLKLLNDLSPEVFAADDSLGWVYQFWQTRRKQEVNESEVKIDARTIASVTQLFTEDYMVQFLLQNTVGAWWAGRHSGQDLPFPQEYLRFLEDNTPAAGDFLGWPSTAKELRILDPCCGSGHFLVASFDLLVRLRMVEEGLSEREAGDAVLRNNLFGLEIDPRCTQIAAFALALTAWKRGGYRELPPLNIACSGTAVGAKKESWLALANGDGRLKMGMDRLYELFKKAPDLGSLIDPRQGTGGDLFEASFIELQPLLEKALQKEKNQNNDELRLAGVAAQGLTRAAQILAGKYTLVITNVPYLKRGKHGVVLFEFCEQNYPEAKADLATVFIQRCLALCIEGGSTSLVTPHNWLFLTSYKTLRKYLLSYAQWDLLVRLGAGAFATISGEVVNVNLLTATNKIPNKMHFIKKIDVSNNKKIIDKNSQLKTGIIERASQESQFKNPDLRIIVDEEESIKIEFLSNYASTAGGIATFDKPQFLFCFWELESILNGWLLSQATVLKTELYGGRFNTICWENGQGRLFNLVAKMKENGYTSGIWKAGYQVWGKRGVLVSLLGDLKCTLYTGQPFDNNCGVIIPNKPSYLPAIWAFCSSPQFNKKVRIIDQALKVTNATPVKVPFDLEYWQKVAEEAGPLPEPYSENPTQWIFKGNPAQSTDPLQVAVARLLGFRWPDQEEDGLAKLAVKEGIVAINSLAGKASAADRLRGILVAALDNAWTIAKQDELLAAVGFSGKSLEQWLRDGFFVQHCKLFHQRPFIWQIWDGRKDGFSTLLNYHKLDKPLLGRLTYTYLGEWITRQQYGVKVNEGGAEARLLAAQSLQDKLVLILKGEAPYDIFVRWKPIEEQPIGWDPDLNDGVRMNIRPFIIAGVLRAKTSINWNKDRGKNPPGTPWGEERINDHHLSLAEKKDARDKVVLNL